MSSAGCSGSMRRDLDKTTEQVARIARKPAKLIELGRELRDDEIHVLEGWAGELYGLPVDSTMEAMALGAQLEAMITDPVYEGKSLAGLIDLVQDRDIPADSHVLYAHLSRQPAINALSLALAVAILGWVRLRDDLRRADRRPGPSRRRDGWPLR